MFPQKVPHSQKWK